MLCVFASLAMTVGVYNVGEIKVHGDDKIEAHGDGR